MNHLWNSLKEKAITAITSPNLFWSWQIELRAARLFVFFPHPHVEVSYGGTPLHHPVVMVSTMTWY